MIDVEKQRERWKRAQQAARERGTASPKRGRPAAPPPPVEPEWSAYPAWLSPREQINSERT